MKMTRSSGPRVICSGMWWGYNRRSVSPVHRGAASGWGEGLVTIERIMALVCRLPLSLTLSPAYRGEGINCVARPRAVHDTLDLQWIRILQRRRQQIVRRVLIGEHAHPSPHGGGADGCCS